MFKSIAPKFINRLDAWLLVNHPVLWTSKIHYVLWHGLMLWAFSALLGTLMPFNLKEYIQFELWYFLFTIAGLIILCFWIYHYVIFNREKNYGSRKPADEYLNFLLVFFAVAVFLLLPWPFESIYNKRIADKYSNEEIFHDLNRLNSLNPYMVNNSGAYFSWTDSLKQKQYFSLRRLNAYGGNYFTPYYIRDTLKYPQLLSDYQIVQNYKPVTDVNLLIQKADSFKIIAAKYGVRPEAPSREIAERYIELLGKSKISAEDFYTYNHTYYYDLHRIFENIGRAKFTTLFIFKHDYLWTMFYFVMSITALLLLFKMSYWQQFLIMLVICFLYPFVMFIFSKLMPYGSSFRSDTAYMLSLLALILYSGFTLVITASSSRQYRPFYNIFNQLFYVTLLYAPLLILAVLHQATNIFHNKDYQMHAEYQQQILKDLPPAANYDWQLTALYNEYWHQEYKKWISITKYMGILLFVTALPFLNALFIKQISLPKKT